MEFYIRYMSAVIFYMLLDLKRSKYMEENLFRKLSRQDRWRL